jgi:hypothetical protein
MTRIVLRCVTQGTFVMALIAALSFTPAFAMGYPSFLLRLDAPSSYPRRPGIKATHKIKKNTKESSGHAPLKRARNGQAIALSFGWELAGDPVLLVAAEPGGALGR